MIISKGDQSIRYTLHEKLGEGGYGSVYACRDKIGIRYACKVLPLSNNKRDCVKREMEMLQLLSKSVKVPRLIDACENEEAFYIVQERCKGGSVKEYVNEKMELYAENTVASIVRGILRGLCHIHDLGIIHRDIKCSNILFADKSDEADIRIIDFGASIYGKVNEAVESDHIVGTPWFMSPEGLSHKFHSKSDIWSVGVLAYQLLSGKMPFNDKANPYNPNMIVLFKSIFTEEPNMNGSVWENLSPEAKDFIKVCLQKDFNQRPFAEDALQHPWLAMSDCTDRFKGNGLIVKPFKFDSTEFMQARTITT